MGAPRGPSTGCRVLPSASLASLLLLTLTLGCMVLGLAIEAHGHSDFDSGASEKTTILPPGRKVGAARPEQRARELALYRPVITRTLTACTTMVIASFPAASCTSYSSPGPNCSFTFRDQDVRELYDCSLIRGIPAGRYIDDPLEDRLAIGTLTYRWDTGLAGVASPRSITMAISALNSSCGSIEFAGTITPSPQRGSLRYGLKPGTVAVKSKTGALGGSSIRGVKVASSGFKAQSTSDPRASGFTVVPVSVTVSYTTTGPNLPMRRDCSESFQPGMSIKVTPYRTSMQLNPSSTSVNSWVDVFVENRYEGIVTNLAINVATSGTLGIWKLEVPAELGRFVQVSRPAHDRWTITMPRVPPGLSETFSVQAFFNTKGRMDAEVTATATYQNAPAAISGLPATIPRITVYEMCQEPCSSDSDCGCSNHYCNVDTCAKGTFLVDFRHPWPKAPVRLQGDKLGYRLEITNVQEPQTVTNVVVEFASSGSSILNVAYFYQVSGWPPLPTSAPWRLNRTVSLTNGSFESQYLIFTMENKTGPFSITATATARSNDKTVAIQNMPYQSPMFTMVSSCFPMTCSSSSECCLGYECNAGQCSLRGELVTFNYGPQSWQRHPRWSPSSTVRSGTVAEVTFEIANTFEFDLRNLTLTMSINGSASVSSLVMTAKVPYVASQTAPWTISLATFPGQGTWHGFYGELTEILVKVTTSAPGTLSLKATATAIVVPKTGPEVAIAMKPSLSEPLTVTV